MFSFFDFLWCLQRSEDVFIFSVSWAICLLFQLLGYLPSTGCHLSMFFRRALRLGIGCRWCESFIQVFFTFRWKPWNMYFQITVPLILFFLRCLLVDDFGGNHFWKPQNREIGAAMVGCIASCLEPGFYRLSPVSWSRSACYLCSFFLERAFRSGHMSIQVLFFFHVDL